jgi:hypothetical protein
MHIKYYQVRFNVSASVVSGLFSHLEIQGSRDQNQLRVDFLGRKNLGQKS